MVLAQPDQGTARCQDSVDPHHDDDDGHEHARQIEAGSLTALDDTLMTGDLSPVQAGQSLAGPEAIVSTPPGGGVLPGRHSGGKLGRGCRPLRLDQRSGRNDQETTMGRTLAALFASAALMTAGGCGGA